MAAVVVIVTTILGIAVYFVMRAFAFLSQVTCLLSLSTSNVILPQVLNCDQVLIALVNEFRFSWRLFQIALGLGAFFLSFYYSFYHEAAAAVVVSITNCNRNEPFISVG